MQYPWPILVVLGCCATQIMWQGSNILLLKNLSHFDEISAIEIFSAVSKHLKMHL